jgi:hypothetical protein
LFLIINISIFFNIILLNIYLMIYIYRDFIDNDDEVITKGKSYKNMNKPDQDSENDDRYVHMCICMCMCICVYIYMYIYVYTYEEL